MEIVIGVAVVLLVLGWLIPSPLSWFARRKLQAENRAFREHLHTQMEIDAAGFAEMKKENNALKQMNENLRISIQTLKSRPERRELQLLHTYDRAITLMLERAPGFAQSWQRVLEHVEKENVQTDTGLRAFVRKVFPAALLGYTKKPVESNNTTHTI